MKHRHAYRFIFLTMFVTYLISNINGELTSTIPIDTPTSISDHHEVSNSIAGSNNNEKVMLSFLFILFTIFNCMVYLASRYIPTWYYKLKQDQLTPVYYGSSYLIFPLSK